MNTVKKKLPTKYNRNSSTKCNGKCCTLCHTVDSMEITRTGSLERFQKCSVCIFFFFFLFAHFWSLILAFWLRRNCRKGKLKWNSFFCRFSLRQSFSFVRSHRTQKCAIKWTNCFYRCCVCSNWPSQGGKKNKWRENKRRKTPFDKWQKAKSIVLSASRLTMTAAEQKNITSVLQHLTTEITVFIDL